MRPLKFRAWNKKLKEWVSPDAVSITLSGVPMAPYETWMEHNLADLVITQFTGLHDRHGKEIWEGDKLRGHATGRVYTVFFKDGAFFARSGNIILTRTDFHNNEVIGNIFEGGE